MRFGSVSLLLFCSVAGLSAQRNTDPVGLADGVHALFVDNQNTRCNDAYTRTQALNPLTPWCNFSAGMAKTNLQPDDIIYVRGDGPAYNADPGTGLNCYIQPVGSGTSGHPITLKAYNGEPATLDGRWNARYGGQSWTSVGGHPGWYQITAGWADTSTIVMTRSQFWNGSNLVPSRTTGASDQWTPPDAKDWYMVDSNTRTIYFRPANGASPNGYQTYFAGCGYGVVLDNGTGQSYWTFYGMHEIAYTVLGWTAGHGSSHITFDHHVGSYNGNNTCDTSRDGTNGHSINYNGGSAGNLIIQNSDISQDVSEGIHISNDSAGGELVTNNNIHDMGANLAWASECGRNYQDGSGIGNQAPGIITRATGGTYTNNTFNNNAYWGLTVESDDGSEGPGNPSNMTIAGNYFKNNFGAGVTGNCGLTVNCANDEVRNNCFDGNAYALTFDGQVNLEGYDYQWNIHDNTIWHTPGGGFAFRDQSVTGSNTFVNNCVDGSCSCSAPNSKAPAAPQNLRIVKGSN